MYDKIIVKKQHTVNEKWLWSNTSTEASYRAIAVSDAIYLGGGFENSAVFGSLPALISDGGYNAFVAKLNKDTNQWMEAAMGAGGGGYDEIYGIATHNDSLYLAAYCEGAANFGSISDTTPNTYGFIAKPRPGVLVL